MKREIWILLFALGALLFNWPVMTIFQDSPVSALFVIWLVFILLMLVTSLVSEREDR